MGQIDNKEDAQGNQDAAPKQLNNLTPALIETHFLQKLGQLLDQKYDYGSDWPKHLDSKKRSREQFEN